MGPATAFMSSGAAQGKSDINDSIDRITLNCANDAAPEVWERAISLAEDAMNSNRLYLWYTDGSSLENGCRGGRGRVAWCPKIRIPVKQYLG